MNKRLKTTRIIIASLIVIMSIVLFSAPRVAEKYIEDNSQELLGRKITMESIRINYLRMALSVKDFVLFEDNDVDTFVSFTEFAVNVDLIPIIQGNYTVASLLLDSFYVNVDFNGEGFNFDDMIVVPDTITEEPIVEVEDTITEDLRFTLNNVIIRAGNIVYYDSDQDIVHEMSNVGFKLPNFSWDNDQAEADLVLKLEPQGELRLRADIDNKNQRYKIITKIIDLDLAQFSGEMKAYLASEGLEGILNNTIAVNGSMKNPEDMVVSGDIELSHFVLNDANGKPILENELFGIYIDSVDLLNSYYGIGKILISTPKIYAQIYSEETNFDQLMQPMTEAAIQDSIDGNTPEEDSASSTAPIYFRVDSFVLDQGELHLTDHTLNRPFNYHITAMNTQVTGISSNAEEVPIDFSMTMNELGNIKGDAQINMTNSNELVYSADLDALNLKSFSPYSEYYIARPVKRGHMNFEGKASMTETVFTAENKIRINDIEMGYKTEDKAQVKVPINLALAILKDKNGDIKIDLPVEGDPSDPEFSIGKIVLSTLTDFLVKVASAPFAMVGDIVGVDPERIKQIHLVAGQVELSEDEQKTVEQIAIALNEKPEMTFIFTQEVPVDIEHQAMALSQVKYNYITSKNQNKDSTEIALLIEELDIKDKTFIEYIQEKDGISDTLSIGEQCVNIIGEDNLHLALIQLAEDRNQALKNKLVTQLNVDPNSVIIRHADTENRNLRNTEPMYSVEITIK